MTRDKIVKVRKRNQESIVPRQLVDWSAAFYAALIAGGVFFVTIGFIIPIFIGGNVWVILRLLSSIVLGSEILAPPATFQGSALFVGIAVHWVLSFIFTSVLALVTHRWGLITGIVLGGLFGWALYLINIYSLTIFFPWFIVMKHPAFLLAHIFFGMTAGGVYELLEVEKFECVKKEQIS